MTDKNIEMMKKIIEEKKQKSKSQGNDKRGVQSHGAQRDANTKFKKGGLFDK
jgi:hypothetical protein